MHKRVVLQVYSYANTCIGSKTNKEKVSVCSHPWPDPHQEDASVLFHPLLTCNELSMVWKGFQNKWTLIYLIVYWLSCQNTDWVYHPGLALTLSDMHMGNPEYVQSCPLGSIIFGKKWREKSLGFFWKFTHLRSGALRLCPQDNLLTTAVHQGLSKYLTAQDTHISPTSTNQRRTLSSHGNLLSLQSQSTIQEYKTYSVPSIQ